MSKFKIGDRVNVKNSMCCVSGIVTNISVNQKQELMYFVSFPNNAVFPFKDIVPLEHFLYNENSLEIQNKSDDYLNKFKNIKHKIGEKITFKKENNSINGYITDYIFGKNETICYVVSKPNVSSNQFPIVFEISENDII